MGFFMNSKFKTYLVVLLCAMVIMSAVSFSFHGTQSHYKNRSLGEKYFKQQKYSAALPYLLAAWRAKPNDIVSGLYLVLVYERLEQREQAKKVLKSLPPVNEVDGKIKAELADMYYYMGDYARAELLYRQILKHNTDFPTRKKLAEVLAWQKKYPEAIVLLEEITVQKPKDDESLELLADVYTWHKDYDVAIQTYQKLLAVRTGERKEAILLKQADALRYAGRTEEAFQLYTRYLRETKE
jgi:tetratricopeptide (TPR) repeat protein